MQILKTTSLNFDVDAERMRIENNFKGRIRLKLLTILDTFSALKWDECESHLRSLDRSEMEFVHYDLFDVIRARTRRKESLQKVADDGAFSDDHRAGLAYPKFQVGEFTG